MIHVLGTLHSTHDSCFSSRLERIHVLGTSWNTWFIYLETPWKKDLCIFKEARGTNDSCFRNPLELMIHVSGTLWNTWFMIKEPLWKHDTWFRNPLEDMIHVSGTHRNTWFMIKEPLGTHDSWFRNPWNTWFMFLGTPWNTRTYEMYIWRAAEPAGYCSIALVQESIS